MYSTLALHTLFISLLYNLEFSVILILFYICHYWTWNLLAVSEIIFVIIILLFFVFVVDPMDFLLNFFINAFNVSMLIDVCLCITKLVRYVARYKCCLIIIIIIIIIIAFPTGVVRRKVDQLYRVHVHACGVRQSVMSRVVTKRKAFVLRAHAARTHASGRQGGRHAFHPQHAAFHRRNTGDWTILGFDWLIY